MQLECFGVLYLDSNYLHLKAGHNFVCERHKCILHSMRAKRKRKDSEEENDYQPEVVINHTYCAYCSKSYSWLPTC